MKRYIGLKASAGSGKTFALTVRYISLLLLDIPANEILTLTFTNKAVASMSERIYKTLFELGNDKDILDAVHIQTSLSIQDILSKKEIIINQYINSSLSIYTIDKFMNKILREFSGYANIDDDFNIEYDDEELLLYKFLISLKHDKFNQLISFAYKEDKKLNAIVEIFKILNEKNEFLPNYNLDEELLYEIEKEVMLNANKIKEFISNQNVSKSAINAVDFYDIKTLIHKGATWLAKDTLSEYTYFKKAKPSDEIEKYFQILKEYMVKYYKYDEAIILKHLFEIFQEFKNFREKFNKQRNKLEFSDITNITYRLLHTFIDKDFLYFRLDSNYSSILIDEFQDTSVLQYKILEPLIQELFAGNNEKLKTFFYVGDPKQSIYRFRGGKKELFDYLANEFYPQLQVEILDTNYRSSKNVVEFVNTIFDGLDSYEYYPQKVQKDIIGYVDVISFENEEFNLFDEIVSKIEYLLTNGIDVNNIAILTYTNKDVLDIYNHLKIKFPDMKITTEMTSKLINEINVKAVINFIKYLYFKENIYLANFNSLISRDLTKDDEIDFNIVDQNLSKIIKDIATYFNIVDQNIIKLLELTSGYNNIVDFIYDIDRLDATSVNKDSSGLQILTIFKSKGLEFDTVFVLDRIKNKNSDKSPLLFEYNEIELENIYRKKSSRENIDIDYKIALEKEKQLQIDDDLNVLYVALTRAKNNMLIFKKNKNSVFDIFGTNFVAPNNNVLYVSNKHSEISKKYDILEYQPLFLGLQDTNRAVTSEMQLDIKARYFGLATHYCLEIMSDFTTKSLDISINLTKNKYVSFLENIDFDDIYQRISFLIEDTVFKKLIYKSQCYKEQAITYNQEIKIIDLLILHNDGSYSIVDYKTTTQMFDEHKQQVRFYKKALENILETTNIKTYLVYLQKENIEILKIN